MYNFKLSNGIEIPAIGLGTWQTPDGVTAINAVKSAVVAGYTHIDCAACYGNEVSVGEGIRQSGIDRERLFVTSKLWNTERGFERTLKAFDKTLCDLGLDYLDLYLIHWPANRKRFANNIEINADTWRAFERLYHEGKVRAIGVSNFLPHHIEELSDTAEIMPMVNQIEYHPGFLQPETVKYCKEHNILVEAWSPLGTGRVLANDKIRAIAEKYKVSPAQLCIRFCLQNEILPLPKSVTESRIKENIAVLDFTISDEDMNVISSMGQFGESGLNPDEVEHTKRSMKTAENNDYNQN